MPNKVLLVEDDFEWELAFRSAFPNNSELITTTSSRKAREIAKKQHPDLIICGNLIYEPMGKDFALARALADQGFKVAVWAINSNRLVADLPYFCKPDLTELIEWILKN